MPKGWYELSCLSKESRKELVREFWLSSLGLDHTESHTFCRFFSSLETIIPCINQPQHRPYEPYLLYQFANGSGFRGNIPLSYNNLNLPSIPDGDYAHFFSIHNGFGSRNGGIFSYQELTKERYLFATYLQEKREELVGCLEPFYRSKAGYQCFITEPEMQRRFPSPNITCNDHLLSQQDYPDKLFSLPGRVYGSFLEWLENYLTESFCV